MTAHPHSLTATLARRGLTHAPAPGCGPGVRHILDDEGSVRHTGDTQATWAWLRGHDCTCDDDDRAACGTFACAVCTRSRVPECCGAADEHETDGADAGACDDCAARAAWEGELW